VARPKTPCGCYAPPPAPPRRRPMAGLGADEKQEQSSWVPYVAGGLLVGAAVAIFAGTLSIKAPGSKRTA